MWGCELPMQFLKNCGVRLFLVRRIGVPPRHPFQIRASLIVVGPDQGNELADETTKKKDEQKSRFGGVIYAGTKFPPNHEKVSENV